MYHETQINGPPDNRKFNGDYAFPFVAAAGEIDAGSIIVRGGLIGMSQRLTPVGATGTAELHGTNTVKKAAATAFASGADVFWDPETGLAVTSGTVRLGLCKITPSEGAESVEVLLNAPSCVVTTATIEETDG